MPTLSWADPWTGSNIDGPVRDGLRLPVPANPTPPDTAPGRYRPPDPLLAFLEQLR